MMRRSEARQGRPRRKRGNDGDLFLSEGDALGAEIREIK